MARRVNWDYIEPLYRAARLSNCEIARQYEETHASSSEWKSSVTEAAIRKRARLKKWKKDLTPAVKRATREKMVRGQVRKTADLELSDAELVDLASTSAAEAVRKVDDGLMGAWDEAVKMLAEVVSDPDQIRLFHFKGEIIEHRIKMGTEEKIRAFKNGVQSLAILQAAIWKVKGLDEQEDEHKEQFEFNAYFGEPPEEQINGYS